MPDVSYDLLREPHFRVTDAKGAEERVSLAGALARLSAGEPTEFAGLRSHQLHPWFAFIVQVAALAARRAGSDGRELPTDEETWTAWLLDLSGGAPEAWCLVVSDLAKPAFLQPPVPEGTIKEFKRVFETPDLLDVLITAKNHEKKRARMARPSPEHWAFALASLQTTEGFLGRGNYGVAKMNGGFGSRPMVGYAPGESTAERFGRDVRVWIDAHDDLVERFGFSAVGVALTWTQPWDGKTSLDLTELNPCFVDCCRRVRLVNESGQVTARGTSSEARRVEADRFKGAVGDIWIPAKRGDPPTALTVSGGGFTYALTQSLLFDEDYAHAAAGRLRPDDGDAPVFIARVLARGQGETNGLHERVVPIPPKARGLLAVPTERELLRAHARWQVESAGEFRLRCLRPALQALLQAGPEKVDFTDKRADVWTARFDRRVDDAFFESLWAAAGREATDARRAWEGVLVRLGRAVLGEASGEVPLPSLRRHRAVAAAERILEGAMRKRCPLFFSTDDTTTQEAST